MNAGSSILPVPLLSWLKATPSWCFLLPEETERNLKFLRGVEPQNAGGTLSSLIFQDYFTISNHQPHAITG